MVNVTIYSIHGSYGYWLLLNHQFHNHFGYFQFFHIEAITSVWLPKDFPKPVAAAERRPGSSATSRLGWPCRCSFSMGKWRENIDEIGDEWGIFLDMEVYFTIYFLFFFGGYHGISPFSDGRSHSLWRSHSRCVLLVKIYMEVFQFMGVPWGTRKSFQLRLGFSTINYPVIGVAILGNLHTNCETLRLPLAGNLPACETVKRAEQGGSGS